MNKKLIVTAALVGGLAFGIAAPAHAADAGCSTDRILVTAEVPGSPAVYGDAPVITPAMEAWVQRVLVSPAVAQVSHVVHHPAVYAARTVIDQPAVEAVPAVDEVSRIVHHAEATKTFRHEAGTTTVHHEAVTTTVQHDAVTRTDYTRYSWTGGGSGPRNGDTPLTSPRNWQANNKKYDGSATGVVHKGNGNGSYFYWAATEVVTAPAWQETVTVTPAWDETVTVSEAWVEAIVTPAWDEKIIEVAAQPGTPGQAEVSHIEYDLVRDAYDETVIDVEAQEAVYADIEHAATDAVLGEPELLTAEIPAQPAVYTEVETCATAPVDPAPVDAGVAAPGPLPLSEDAAYAATVAAPAALALTGGGVAPILPIGAGVLIAGGLAALFARRARRDQGARASQND